MMLTSHTDDEGFMRRALRLAERGRGTTSPNPLVGAVVVDDEGVVVGSGAHRAVGGAHAEVFALEAAGSRARGATLYCTLEPCSHRGRTGPCAPLVAGAGIRRAVIAMQDPNPLVAGRGLAHLRERGVQVDVGLLQKEAEALNRPFITVMRHRRPHVTMKVALSLDGQVAGAPGVRTWLTGKAANRLIHRERAEIDAVAVGAGTALTDDPLLTPRGAFRVRALTRVVFDRRLALPPDARLLSTLAVGPVIIVGTASAAGGHPERERALRAAGADLELLADAPSTSFLNLALERLTTRGISSIVVEGGPTLHRAFWDAGLVDRVQMFVTPRPLGPGGVPWLPWPIPSRADFGEAIAVPLGEDVLIEGHVHRID